MLIKYFSNFVSPGASCLTPPSVCLFSLEAVKFNGVSAGAWLEGADTYDAQLWLPSVGAWVDYATGIEQGQTVVVEVDYEIGLKARWAAHVGSDVYYSDEVPVTTFCCEGKLPPSTPDAPALAKTCSPPSVTISSPAFSEVEDAETESIEIRRRLKPSGEWESVHEFEAEGDWDDEDVSSPAEYEYSARACNDAGCSAWSSAASISLISTTTVSFASPPADATWKGLKLIRVNGIAGLTNPAMSWNGASIGTPTYQNGEWVLSWPTYYSAQGAGVLRFEATGADGCRCFVERALTLDNSAPAQTASADIICRENVAPDGERIKSASFRFEAAPLPEAAWLRTFMRICAYLDDEAADADFDLDFDEDTWAEGQPLLMERGRVLPDGRTQWLWFDLLAKKDETVGKRLIFRLRWDAGFVSLGYSTLGTGSSIVKFRDDGASDDENYRVLFLARKADNSGAAIYAFDGSAATVLETGDGALLNLENAPFNAPAAFDFALAADKLWIAGSASDLFFIDMDSGEAGGNMKPRGEARDLVAVETIGGKIYAIFVDADLEEEQTICWRWDGSWKNIWTLDESVTKVTLATSDTPKLLLACGANLYQTPGDTAPALVHAFASAISTPGGTFTGLENGKLLELVNNEWIERLDRTGAIAATTAVSFVTGEIEDPRGVAGEVGSTALLEATVNPAVWSDGRVLSAPALMSETVSGVSALHRFLKQTAEAAGDPNQPGYVPATYREILLIGTTPDGALLAIEQNALAQNPLAVPATQAGVFRAHPFLEAVPVEE